MHRLAHRLTQACIISALLVASFATAAAATTTTTTTTTTTRVPQPESAAIVNGTQVTDAEFASRWPFIVALVGSSARSQYDGQLCGGSLIDDQHVLTAAHCVTLDPSVVSATTSIRVIAKTRTLSDSSLGVGETGPRSVAEIFVHPDFAENQSEGFRFDVAVLRLSKPISAAATIQLVQPNESGLWRNGAGGVDAFIAGWGDTDPRDEGDPGAKFPQQLRHTTVPLRSDATCGSTVGGGYGTAFESATNLCGGTLQTSTTLGTDSCQGDSGGPLIVDAGAGTYRLAGVTSWGDGCAERTFGSYSRLDALRSWISSIPGATDGAAGTGGPGGTMPIVALRRESGDFTHVTLAWAAPASGTAPERYAVWQRTTVEGERVDRLIGITPRTRFRAATNATTQPNAFMWNVRPLDAAGSNGSEATIQAGPDPDRVRPSTPPALRLVRAGTASLVVRWNPATDPQSGIASYQVQRRPAGRLSFATVEFTQQRSSTIEQLGSGQRVLVRVRAIDQAGNASGWSPARSFTTR